MVQSDKSPSWPEDESHLYSNLRTPFPISAPLTCLKFTGVGHGAEELPLLLERALLDELKLLEEELLQELELLLDDELLEELELLLEELELLLDELLDDLALLLDEGVALLDELGVLLEGMLLEEEIDEGEEDEDDSAMASKRVDVSLQIVPD